MHDEHNHGHTHEHEHSHEHGHHTHEHEHEHTHAHQPAGSGDTARTLALLKYMLEHNRQHASELGGAGEKLYGDGFENASELIAEAVHYFDHGNDKLREAIEALTGER